MALYLRRITGVWQTLQGVAPPPTAIDAVTAELVAESKQHGGVSVWKHDSPEERSLVLVAVAAAMLHTKGPLYYVELTVDDIAASGLQLKADAPGALTPLLVARQHHYNLIGMEEQFRALVTHFATRLGGAKPVTRVNHDKLRPIAKQLLDKGVEGIPQDHWLRG